MKPNGIITFTTDFGDTDGYVGIMKGVILSINPDARLVDISNQVPGHDIGAGAFLLNYSYRYFPVGTVHLVIVDPGVGSTRRAIAVETDNYYFIAPDNGILHYLFQTEKDVKVIDIQNRNYALEKISRTFHGRDIFAPAAAHLSRGLPIDELGPHITDVEHGKITSPEIDADKITGEIAYIDRFGNLICNIPGFVIGNRSCSIQILDFQIGKLSDSYSAGDPGMPVAIIGSSGYLEIAVNKHSAKKFLNAALGDRITVHFNGHGEQ
ncbi:hypothetical protein GF337_04970 [candidate division KSB1 bacterium]|nr:hypothetical protein [candidate division KSB1 bacterium]